MKFEEYYVDVEDVRLKEHEASCEEDEDKLFYCTRSLKGIDCDSKYACPFEGKEGGLFTEDSNKEFMSASGGLNWRYEGDTLFFGNDKHYTYETGDSCETKEFTAKFYIKDSKSVSEFAISEVFENNVMDIWVNGHLVYEGEKYGIRSTNPNCIGEQRFGEMECWLNACQEHWRPHHQELKGLLKDGWNHMDIKLRYTRAGHAGVKLKAKQYCCKSWDDKWESDCPSF